MEKQGLLMRGCWWKCWKTLNTFRTIENASKYYGKTRFANAGILEEMLERIEKPSKLLKIQANIMEKQGLLINAGMMAEMLESIENL